MAQKTQKPPRIAQWLLSHSIDAVDLDSVLGDFEELCTEVRNESGVLRGQAWYWKQAFKSLPHFVRNSIYWKVIMIRNYLKIAYRNFMGHKLFSLINVSGLAIGIATCMILNVWVQRELSYDRFHENAHRIYRIERELFRDNLYSRWPITSGAYKQALIDDYPEIENAVRLWRREFSIRDHKNSVHRQGLFAADNSIFDIFDFDLREGDQASALSRPMSVVLTQERALKYFGTEDVIGRSLSLEWNDEQVDFAVTGILNDVPENSHILFDMLISISSYPQERFSEWRSNYLYTYVLVEENTSRCDLEQKLKTFVSMRLEPYYGDLLSIGLGIHEVLKMHIFPITDIHLNPSVDWELEAGGNITSVYIFSSIAVIILIIACMNFINLSTARVNKRANEVCLRKTIGAGKGELRAQFIQESLFMARVSMLLAMVLLSAFVPVYNAIFNKNLTIYLFFQPQNLFILIAITLAVGLFAGLYPAFYLTKFEPAGVLRGGSLSGRGKSVFRRNMVIIQFAISITLIIGTFTVYKQMNYVQTRALGFNRENVVVIPARSSQVSAGFTVFRDELLHLPNIVSVSASSEAPTEAAFSNTSFLKRQKPREPISITFITTDYDFVDTYKMEVLAGRAFSRDFSTDTTGTILLNEAAAQRIGWTPEEAIGKTLAQGHPDSAFEVVGVVRNFNFKSLRSEVEPLALLLYPDYIRAISVRISPGDIGNSLDQIQRKWEDSFPGEQFEFNFLDDLINQLYENEKRMQSLFVIFSGLSILVACLGLLGLAVFAASERIKEIGIRKALGASTANIILLMSEEFIEWIIIANIVAWPIAWYVMNEWLQSFAYKTEMGWVLFLTSGIISLIIAMLTFSFQAVKAAHANPADSLKYE